MKMNTQTIAMIAMGIAIIWLCMKIKKINKVIAGDRGKIVDAFEKANVEMTF